MVLALAQDYRSDLLDIEDSDSEQLADCCKALNMLGDILTKVILVLLSLARAPPSSSSSLDSRSSDGV